MFLDSRCTYIYNYIYIYIYVNYSDYIMYNTHTCSETSYRITDVECIARAKNTSVKPDRNGLMIGSEKLCEEIFLRPCSKDLLVLMQLSQIAKTVQ